MADMNETLTLTQIKKLKVAELRERLQKIGLPIHGLKPDLVNRLFEAQNASKNQATEALSEQNFSQRAGLSAQYPAEGYVEPQYNPQQYQQPTSPYQPPYPPEPTYTETPARQYLPEQPHMQYMPQENQYQEPLSSPAFYHQHQPSFPQMPVSAPYANPMDVPNYSQSRPVADNLMMPPQIPRQMEDPPPAAPSATSIPPYCDQRQSYPKAEHPTEVVTKESASQELLNFDDVTFGSESCETFTQPPFEPFVEPHQEIQPPRVDQPQQIEKHSRRDEDQPAPAQVESLPPVQCQESKSEAPEAVAMETTTPEVKNTHQDRLPTEAGHPSHEDLQSSTEQVDDPQSVSSHADSKDEHGNEPVVTSYSTEASAADHTEESVSHVEKERQYASTTSSPAGESADSSVTVEEHSQSSTQTECRSSTSSPVEEPSVQAETASKSPEFFEETATTKEKEQSVVSEQETFTKKTAAIETDVPEVPPEPAPFSESSSHPVDEEPSKVEHATEPGPKHYEIVEKPVVHVEPAVGTSEAVIEFPKKVIKLSDGDSGVDKNVGEVHGPRVDLKSSFINKDTDSAHGKMSADTRPHGSKSEQQVKPSKGASKEKEKARSVEHVVSTEKVHNQENREPNRTKTEANADVQPPKTEGAKTKLTKNQKRKLRKQRKQMEKKLIEKIQPPPTDDDDKMDIDDDNEDDDEVEIEYVPDQLSKDPIYFQYLKVFDKFRTGDLSRNYDLREEETIDPIKKMLERKKPVELELKDEDDKKDGEQKLSKRKLKQLTRMSVADLKQRVTHPELVEMHDVTAKDPIMLLHLKATRNSVPVPRHWCYKRKYLQGKRGYEKPPFKLPEFIRRTGIMEMRQALAEKEDAKSLKTKMREKIRPKMGKIDIDYHKLHDAFFKWQTKPKVTIHGDLYYEGKEFETRLKEKKPGDLSNDLRLALGMPTGPNAHKCPPPWLIAMQRYGPPPSYPNLKIPGLNAPIPDGCSFGYHAGGWGKPPVDEYGRPLYGDVFGISQTHDHLNAEEEVDRTLWGEMESEEEDEEEEEEEEEEVSAPAGVGKLPVPGKEPDESGLMTPSEGLVTPSGISSIPAGMETPDIIELRKRKIEAEMESGENQQLFTVIPEKKMERVGKEMMGSTHVYDISGSIRKGHGVELALDPNEIDLDSGAITAKYEQTLKEQSSHLEKEDLSDMVAEHAARQKRKKQQESSKPTKKYRDFKF